MTAFVTALTERDPSGTLRCRFLRLATEGIRIFTEAANGTRLDVEKR